jgi:NAD(P)H dehydrogenase (quinone)
MVFKNLIEKIGAAFVTAGGISAGEELVQMNILHSMLIFGMMVAGSPGWQQPFGASGMVAENPFQTAQ